MMSFDASGNEDGRNESSQDVSQVSHINELLQQWDRLLSELENFQAFLKKRELEHTVELRRFQSRILAERRKLEKVLDLNSSLNLRNRLANNLACSLTHAARKPHMPSTLPTSLSMMQSGLPQRPVVALFKSTSESIGGRRLLI